MNIGEIENRYAQVRNGLCVAEAEIRTKKFHRKLTNGSQQLPHVWVFEHRKNAFSGFGYRGNLPNAQCEICSEQRPPKEGAESDRVYIYFISQAAMMVTDEIKLFWALSNHQHAEALCHRKARCSFFNGLCLC